MLEYNKIDISEGVDIKKKTNKCIKRVRNLSLLAL